MKKKNKILLFLFAVSILISLIISKVVGRFAYSFLHPVVGLGPQMKCPECFDGFIIAYLFFVSLFLNFVDLKTKYKIIFFLPIILFINPPFEFLIISLGIVILGWLLAQSILLIKKQIKK